jgi:hypothetical protein
MEGVKSHDKVAHAIKFTSFFSTLTIKQQTFIIKHLNPAQVLLINEIIINLLHNQAISINRKLKSILKKSIADINIVTDKKYTTNEKRRSIFPTYASLIITCIKIFTLLDGISEVLPNTN